MGILGEVLSKADPIQILKLVTEYGPLIDAIIGYIQTHKEDEKRAAVMDGITRGFHNASETGDTTQLMEAIRSHCGPSGCGTP